MFLPTNTALKCFPPKSDANPNREDCNTASKNPKTKQLANVIQNEKLLEKIFSIKGMENKINPNIK